MKRTRAALACQHVELEWSELIAFFAAAREYAAANGPAEVRFHANYSPSRCSHVCDRLASPRALHAGLKAVASMIKSNITVRTSLMPAETVPAGRPYVECAEISTTLMPDVAVSADCLYTEPELIARLHLASILWECDALIVQCYPGVGLLSANFAQVHRRAERLHTERLRAERMC